MTTHDGDNTTSLSAILIDTETTGITDPVAVEIAWLEREGIHNADILRKFHQRYNPGKPIELGAMATHHIMNEDVTHCPPTSDFKLPEGTEYIIGHNVDYDWKAIGSPDVRRICTLALSRHLFPNLDSHTQSAMVYHFKGRDAKPMLDGSHSAIIDVRNCHVVLQYLIDRMHNELGWFTAATSSWSDLWDISEWARVPTTMQFGKHKGELISEIPKSYKEWLLRQPDVDPYLVKALIG